MVLYKRNNCFDYFVVNPLPHNMINFFINIFYEYVVSRSIILNKFLVCIMLPASISIRINKLNCYHYVLQLSILVWMNRINNTSKFKIIPFLIHFSSSRRILCLFVCCNNNSIKMPRLKILNYLSLIYVWSWYACRALYTHIQFFLRMIICPF